MQNILKDLRQFFEDDSSSSSLLINIADEIRNGKQSDITDDYFWELNGEPSEEIANAVANGETQGEGWELIVDNERGVNLEDYDPYVVALLQYLDRIEDLDDIEIEELTNSKGEKITLPDTSAYYVFADYDDAEDEAKYWLEQDIDEFGVVDLLGINTVRSYLDNEYFDEMQDEYWESTASELTDEELLEWLRYNNYDLSDYAELKEKDDDSDEDEEIDEDDLDNWELTAREDAEEKYIEENTWSDSIDWYDSNFGDLEEFIKNNPQAIDEQSLIDELISIDGPASQLARYDGQEDSYKYNGTEYYIYRVD